MVIQVMVMGEWVDGGIYFSISNSSSGYLEVWPLRRRGDLRRSVVAPEEEEVVSTETFFLGAFFSWLNTNLCEWVGWVSG